VFVSFSPDGKVLLSAGQEGMVKLWDVPGGVKTRAARGK
jgi:WD40 repeat protein